MSLGPTTTADASSTPELESVRMALASAQSLLLSSEDEALRMRAEVERLRALVGEEPSGAEPRLAPTGPMPVRPRVRPGLAVLDVDPSWETSAGADLRVVVMRPAADVPASMGAVAPISGLVNLAAPGAFDALSALRESGCTTPFWGCLACPGVDGILPLGRVEPVRRGFDPEQAIARLGCAPGKKVLTASPDAERFIALRHQLVHRGMAVSMAWDVKQATELLAMLAPDVAIVDLALPPRGGHRLVATLAGMNPVPLTMIVPADGDAAPGFAAALAEQTRGGAGVTRARLVGELLRRTEEVRDPLLEIPGK